MRFRLPFSGLNSTWFIFLPLNIIAIHTFFSYAVPGITLLPYAFILLMVIQLFTQSFQPHISPMNDKVFVLLWFVVLGIGLGFINPIVVNYNIASFIATAFIKITCRFMTVMVFTLVPFFVSTLFYDQEDAHERIFRIYAFNSGILAFWVLGTYLLSAYTIFKFLLISFILFFTGFNTDRQAHPYLFLHHIYACFSYFLVYSAAIPITCITIGCIYALCITSITVARLEFGNEDENDLTNPHNRIYKQPYDKFIDTIKSMPKDQSEDIYATIRQRISNWQSETHTTAYIDRSKKVEIIEKALKQIQFIEDIKDGRRGFGYSNFSVPEQAVLVEHFEMIARVFFNPSNIKEDITLSPNETTEIICRTLAKSHGYCATRILQELYLNLALSIKDCEATYIAVDHLYTMIKHKITDFLNQQKANLQDYIQSELIQNQTCTYIKNDAKEKIKSAILKRDKQEKELSQYHQQVARHTKHKNPLNEQIDTVLEDFDAAVFSHVVQQT